MSDKLTQSRDGFQSRFGFILSCIGSAVGMGCIWLFPYRVGQYGGFAFLVPFLIFVIGLGFCGVIGEMAFGRAMGTGPVGAFQQAVAKRGGKFGGVLGMISLIGSIGVTVGYTVICGWILRFLFGALTGAMFDGDSAAYFAEISGHFGSIGWHVLAIIITFIVMNAGVSSGIERANKIVMPLFFLLFIGLAIFVSTIPGAEKGYEFLFNPDWSALANPKTWMYALGQAFFSLSLVGCGTIVYGSYLKKDVDIPFSGIMVSVFELIASILVALTILPAVFAFGADPQSGPPLIFIVLPSIFAQIPGGQFLAVIFFLAVFFAGVTSLMNLYESPIEALQKHFGIKRRPACVIVLSLSLAAGLFLEDSDVVGHWMDLFTIYITPFAALLAAIMFFWVCGKGFAAKEINTGCARNLGGFIEGMGKYVYCGVTFIVLILGIVFGGIG
ncbi:MAG: sodium-dependent transporter [Peptococcaceae bacterium]|nr:sodium-dependent transporter [Peptococcaceae bacterium]